MKRTATAGAYTVLDIEFDILPRQMVGKRRPPRRGFGIVVQRDDWMTYLCPGDIGVEVLQPKRELIAVDSFRSPSELRALQALDDEPKPFHLGTRCSKLRVILDHLCSKLAHQPMQGVNIDRQRGEVEMHARESNRDWQ